MKRLLINPAGGALRILHEGAETLGRLGRKLGQHLAPRASRDLLQRVGGVLGRQGTQKSAQLVGVESLQQLGQPFPIHFRQRGRGLLDHQLAQQLARLLGIQPLEAIRQICRMQIQILPEKNRGFLTHVFSPMLRL